MWLHLLKIDLKKMTSYRTFWVICGLYFIILTFTTASGMEMLKLLARSIEGLGAELNINRIPLYHFPDVWLNLIWFCGWLKILPAIMVVVSISNEFSYRTLRQNVIDGLSRSQFLLSKILMNVVLSAMSMILVFVIGLVTGLIYSPHISFDQMFTDMEFLPAYFLEVFSFLSFATMLATLVQRSGLTIVIVMFAQAVELFITEKFFRDSFPEIIPFFPMKSIWYLIEFPLPRYWFQEIKDYITLVSVVTIIFWTAVYNCISYLKLKRSDI
jgi:ABC-2 type transport system permease protein